MSVEVQMGGTPIDFDPATLSDLTKRVVINTASVMSNNCYRAVWAGDTSYAIECGLEAVTLNPAHMEAHCNLGLAYWSAGEYVQAMTMFEKSISIRDNAMSHLNLGIIRLGIGLYEDGWAGYKHRFAAHGRKVNTQLPEWDGEDLDGTLFVIGEQGVGDQILFASMIPSLQARGIKFIWHVEKRLLSLFEYAFPDVPFLAPDGARPDNWGDVKAYIHAADLGQYLRPDAKSFPGRPYLNIPPAVMGDGVKIGVSWRSANAKNGAAKSAALSQWAGIFGKSARFINLQYGSTDEEIAGTPIENVIGLDLKDDFEALAQVISACDLVITVSNTVAHLACAMGKPTWVMVPHGIGKYWCWGYWGIRSDWYPSARIFHQIEARDWGSTLAAIEAKLSEHLT